MMSTRRPHLPNRGLIVRAAAMLCVILTYLALLPVLPTPWRTPGNPYLYITGVVGTLLLLSSLIFVWVKRSRWGGSPTRWYVDHVNAAMMGTVFVVVHMAGVWQSPPALLLLNLAGLMALGIWARIGLSNRIAGTFGTKTRGFSPAVPEMRDRLHTLIEQKHALLARLDPVASEATFSLTMWHWFFQPCRSWGYARLARKENQLIGTRQSVGPVQAYWRALHLGLAGIFVLGILIHVVVVTFFAGYATDYGEIHWWHLSAW